MTLMALSISVLAGELLFVFLGVFTLLLCIGVYANAGHRARNKARRLLDDLNSFVQTLI